MSDTDYSAHYVAWLLSMLDHNMTLAATGASEVLFSEPRSVAVCMGLIALLLYYVSECRIARLLLVLWEHETGVRISPLRPQFKGFGTAWSGRLLCKQDNRWVRSPQGPPKELT